MDLWQAISGRRSIRRFTGDPVPDADLRRMVSAAGLAPSAGNQQMWRFIAVRNRALLGEMGQAVMEKIEEMLTWRASQDFLPRITGMKRHAMYFAEAPAAIAALTETYGNPVDRVVLPAHGLSFEDIHQLRADPGTQSFGAAIQNLLLAAHALGYGTCWMSGPMYAKPKLERLLGIEEPWRLGAMIALGVPAESPAPRARKDISEILQIID